MAGTASSQLYPAKPPTPRQLLWRSTGYMLSAGKFLFLDTLVLLWDEDYSLGMTGFRKKFTDSAAKHWADIGRSSAAPLR